MDTCVRLIFLKKESLKQEMINLMDYMETTTESIQKVFYIIQKQLLENLHAKAELYDLKDIDLKAELFKNGIRYKFS